jgi:hypothetical protein
MTHANRVCNLLSISDVPAQVRSIASFVRAKSIFMQTTICAMKTNALSFQRRHT